MAVRPEGRGAPGVRGTSEGWGLAPYVLAGAGLAAGVVAVGAAATVAASAAKVARTVVRPPRQRAENIAVHRVWSDADGAYIELDATPDTRLGGAPGVYGIGFGEGTGHAVVGEITDQSWRTVTRRVLRVDAGVLDASVRRVGLAGWVWLDPAAAGIERFENVPIPAPLGDNPAWVVPGRRRSSKWMIHVHGWGGRRAEVLRSVLLAERYNFTSIAVSYRNDPEAVPSPDHRYGLGTTEWEDVEAAIAYAAGHGAKHIVLVGWSMGGAIVLQTAARTAYADLLAGVILDSPVVDWRETLVYQAEASGIPEQVRRLAMAMLADRRASRLAHLSAPIDWGCLDWVARSDELTWPTLILHSDDDGFVPSGPSRELAAARPDLVTFVPFHTARHCKLWNYDRDFWERSVVAWLRGRKLSAGTVPPVPAEQGQV